MQNFHSFHLYGSEIIFTRYLKNITSQHFVPSVITVHKLKIKMHRSNGTEVKMCIVYIVCNIIIKYFCILSLINSFGCILMILNIQILILD